MIELAHEGKKEVCMRIDGMAIAANKPVSVRANLRWPLQYQVHAEAP